jgi:glutathione-independent formaldehyde dehydrogenase
MQPILWNRSRIAGTLGVQMITLDQAPRAYAKFDSGAPKKFVQVVYWHEGLTRP